MKYLLTSFIIFSLATNTTAQVSIGFRSGATRHFSTQYNKQDALQYSSGKQIPETQCDKELFGRYCFGRFSLETTLNYSKKTTQYESSYNYPYPMPPIVPKITETTGVAVENNFIISSTIQYNTSRWGKRKQWRNYVGLSMSQVYEHRSYKEVTIDDGVAQPAKSGVYHDTNLWPGLTHTLSWDVDRNIQISTMAFFRHSFNYYNGSFLRNSMVGMQIGASYTISH